MFVCRFLCGHRFPTHLGKYQGTRLLDPLTGMCQLLEETANHLPWRLYHVVFPPAMNESSCCSAHIVSSPTQPLVLACVLDCGHSNRCLVVSHCCFTLPFPEDIWYGASFHMLVICISSLVRSLFRLVSYFWVSRVLCISLWYKSFIRYDWVIKNIFYRH